MTTAKNAGFIGLTQRLFCCGEMHLRWGEFSSGIFPSRENEQIFS